MNKTSLALLCGIAFLAGCSKSGQQDLKPALDAISADSLLGEIKILSSDDFEGRKPGSAGEAKTTAYMTDQFRLAGLKPGNPDGTWLQNVPLAGIISKAEPNITVKGRKLALVNKKDYVAVSDRYVPEVTVESSTSSSSATAWSRPNTTGTTTKMST